MSSPRVYFHSKEAVQRPESTQLASLCREVNNARDVERHLQPKAISSAIPLSSFSFMMLPPELRRRVYSCAIGGHVIHVGLEFHSSKREGVKLLRLLRYACVCPLWEAETYKLYAQPITVKSRIDWHMQIPEEEHPAKLHGECYLLSENLIQHENCFGLLYVSRETHRETRRLLFATTKWSIDNPYVLERWLAVVPPDLLSTIRHLNLDMHMEGSISDNSSIAAAWKVAISGPIPTKLLGLQTLSLSIHVGEKITSWTQSKEMNIDNMLLPLRRLNTLQSLTAVVHDSFSADHEGYCQQKIYESNTHGYHEVYG
ncbi:hypothetical protein G7Y79_00009g026450 [Physcia stellaris]|nr:hypothetical protein G7Y79_00009g026450 [Physcia stellaris]